MPMKISDFTGNMQTLVERGEVHLGVQWEGEVYLQMDKGISVAPVIWDAKPILTQTKTISRYSDPIQKKLALRADERGARPRLTREKAGSIFYLRPTNGKAPVSDKPREQRRGQHGQRHGRALDPGLELVCRQRGRHRRDHQRDLRRLIHRCRAG